MDTITILVGISSIVAVILSVYTIIDNKAGARKKEIIDIKAVQANHEIRIVATERVTGVVEDYMEDLLLESLKRK